VTALFRRVQSKVEGLAFARIRFYVVQNDEIAEFSGMTAATVLDGVRLLLTAVQAARSRAAGV
jgi:hypothetical protein